MRHEIKQILYFNIWDTWFECDTNCTSVVSSRMITSMAIAVNGQALRFFAVMHVNLWQVFVPGLLQSALVMSRFDKKKKNNVRMY